MLYHPFPSQFRLFPLFHFIIKFWILLFHSLFFCCRFLDFICTHVIFFGFLIDTLPPMNVTQGLFLWLLFLFLLLLLSLKLPLRLLRKLLVINILAISHQDVQEDAETTNQWNEILAIFRLENLCENSIWPVLLFLFFLSLLFLPLLLPSIVMCIVRVVSELNNHS